MVRDDRRWRKAGVTHVEGLGDRDYSSRFDYSNVSDDVAVLFWFLLLDCNNLFLDHGDLVEEGYGEIGCRDVEGIEDGN